MPVAALLLALAAAFVHAGWNLLLAREEDVHAATAGAVAAGVVAFAPLARDSAPVLVLACSALALGARFSALVLGGPRWRRCARAAS